MALRPSEQSTLDIRPKVNTAVSHPDIMWTSCMCHICSLSYDPVRLKGRQNHVSCSFSLLSFLLFSLPANLTNLERLADDLWLLL